MKRAVKKKDMKKGVDVKKPKQPLVFSSGSTLLDQALGGGIKPGTIVNLVGDSSAGKTFLAWTMMVKLFQDRRGYSVYYDEPEQAMGFDLEKLFGKYGSMITTLGPPSDTVQDYYASLEKVIAQEDPFVYVLDSFDALTSNEEKARKMDEGSYKTEKPKLLTELLRRSVRDLQRLDSVLFIISQAKDKIGMAFGDKKTRSGGKALKFYSTHEIWMAVKGAIKRKNRMVGVNVVVKVKKNKVTGRLRTVEFPILFDYGIDDLTSCVNFLIEEGAYTKTKSGKKIDTKCKYGVELSMADFIKMIEEENREQEIKDQVCEVWESIEKSIETKRKARF